MSLVVQVAADQFIICVVFLLTGKEQSFFWSVALSWHGKVEDIEYHLFQYHLSVPVSPIQYHLLLYLTPSAVPMSVIAICHSIPLTPTVGLSLRLGGFLLCDLLICGLLCCFSVIQCCNISQCILQCIVPLGHKTSSLAA